jgi:tyrosyl-tRNA synthetase
VEIAALKSRMENGEVHPKKVKMSLAQEITARFQDAKEAERAAKNFDQIFKKHELPDEIPEKEISVIEEEIWLPKLLVEAELVSSTSDGRRMIQQNAVSLDGDKVSDPNAKIPALGSVLIKVGKRRFCRISFS